MNHLRRELAPISDAAWEEIESEAKRRLSTYLGARRLVDFDGPHGWEYSAIDLGRSEEVADTPEPGVGVHLRKVQPLVELRVPFTLNRRELDDIDRGAPDPDLDAVDQAARTIARAETTAIFHGYPAGGIRGIAARSTHDPVALAAQPQGYAASVAAAVQKLKEAGIGGPLALALSSEVWATVVETVEGGYPLFEHLRRAVVGGSVVWAPGLDAAMLLSQRGGDFRFVCGQDLSIGYLDHDAETVTLYLEESFTFRVLSDDAAVVLTRP